MEWFGNKKFVLAVVLLASILGGSVLAQGPLFHSQTTILSDPATLIWQATDPNNNLGEFSLQGNGLTDCSTGCGPFFNGNGNTIKFDTTQSGTSTLVTLSKSVVGDLGIISGKGLQAAFNWGASGAGFAPNSNGASSTDVWGYYLTSNKTVPTHDIGSSNAYNPRNDPSVVYLLELYVTGANQLTHVLFLQRSTTNTIASEDNGCIGGSSCFLATTITAHPVTSIQWSTVQLNFTGVTGGSGSCTPTGGGCSMLFAGDTATAQTGTQNIPWFKYQGQSYYLGIYALPASNAGYQIYWAFQGGTLVTPTGKAMNLAYFVVAPNTPVPIDTGGYFGPILRSLINLGIFILSSIFGFIAFVLPPMKEALGILENVLTQVLDFLGNLLWPGSNLGTLLAGFLNAIIQLFTNTSYGLPAFFANFPSYFTNFLSWLQITFPFLAPMFSIANAILGFAVSVVPTGVTIMTLGLQMFLFGYGTLILASFFIYTGDDGIGGFLTFLGTLEALSFKILNIIATLTNLGLDILVIMVSLIPKPLIQMSASKLPRLPTLETGASMAFPVMDLGEARNGNMVVYWLWSMGLYMLAWFESRNPSLPGSIGAIYAPLATNMRILSAYLPLLQAMVLISGGLLLAWTAMMPLRTIGFDIMGLSPFGVSLGRRTGAGPSTVKLAVGKKHVVGPAAKAEKERKRQKEFEAKKEEEARKGIVKHARTQEEKRRSEELRKKEIERKPTGKDIKGPDLT